MIEQFIVEFQAEKDLYVELETNNVENEIHLGEITHNVSDLQPATKTTLGGVIVGERLDVNQKGLLSAAKQFEEMTNEELMKIMNGVIL